MRRAPIILTSTVLGTAAVITFKPRQPELSSAAVASSAATAPEASAGSGSGASGSSSSGSSGSSSGTRTATGTAVDTVYGAAQVRVTVSGGKITKVEAVQLQNADPKSVQISNYAAPLLAESALAKQSGDIDAVSGATYTSQSYEASLQSALDQLGFAAQDGSKGSTQTDQLQQGGGGHDHGDRERGDDFDRYDEDDRGDGPPPGWQ